MLLVGPINISRRGVVRSLPHANPLQQWPERAGGAKLQLSWKGAGSLKEPEDKGGVLYNGFREN